MPAKCALATGDETVKDGDTDALNPAPAVAVDTLLSGLASAGGLPPLTPPGVSVLIASGGGEAEARVWRARCEDWLLNNRILREEVAMPIPTPAELGPRDS